MRALREHFSLLREFLRGGFLKTVRNCVIALVLAAGLGYLAAWNSPAVAEKTLETFQQMVQETGLIDDVGNLSVFALLMNNWRAMLLSAAYGFLPFLYLPLISLFSNGALLGLMAGYYRNQGLSLGLYAAGILPHGIFELSALVLSIACGIRLCRNLCYMVMRSPMAEPLVELLTDLLRVLLLLVMPLTVVAAFVECYVTPAIMGLFL